MRFVDQIICFQKCLEICVFENLFYRLSHSPNLNYNVSVYQPRERKKPMFGEPMESGKFSGLTAASDVAAIEDQLRYLTLSAEIFFYVVKSVLENDKWLSNFHV